MIANIFSGSGEDSKRQDCRLKHELCARELSLEHTTAAKDDFQHQSTQLTKELKGTYSSPYRLSLLSVFY
jgi:hypothetical protein